MRLRNIIQVNTDECLDAKDGNSPPSQPLLVAKSRRLPTCTVLGPLGAPAQSCVTDDRAPLRVGLGQLPDPCGKSERGDRDDEGCLGFSGPAYPLRPGQAADKTLGHVPVQISMGPYNQYAGAKKMGATDAYKVMMEGGTELEFYGDAAFPLLPRGLSGLDGGGVGPSKQKASSSSGSRATGGRSPGKFDIGEFAQDLLTGLHHARRDIRSNKKYKRKRPSRYADYGEFITKFDAHRKPPDGIEEYSAEDLALWLTECEDRATLRTTYPEIERIVDKYEKKFAPSVTNSQRGESEEERFVREIPKEINALLERAEKCGFSAAWDWFPCRQGADLVIQQATQGELARQLRRLQGLPRIAYVSNAHLMGYTYFVRAVLAMNIVGACNGLLQFRTDPTVRTALGIAWSVVPGLVHGYTDWQLTEVQRELTASRNRPAGDLPRDTLIELQKSIITLEDQKKASRIKLLISYLLLGQIKEFISASDIPSFDPGWGIVFGIGSALAGEMIGHKYIKYPVEPPDTKEKIDDEVARLNEVPGAIEILAITAILGEYDRRTASYVLDVDRSLLDKPLDVVQNSGLMTGKKLTNASVGEAVLSRIPPDKLDSAQKKMARYLSRR